MTERDDDEVPERDDEVPEFDDERRMYDGPAVLVSSKKRLPTLRT